MKNVVHNTLNTLSVCTVGLFIVPQMLVWLALGKMRVFGYRRLLKEVFKGNLVIIANHPSLLETVLIPFLVFPFNLCPKYLVWNTPDEELFPQSLRWLYTCFKCLPVQRNHSFSRSNVIFLKRAVQVLNKGESVLVFPEGGRTWGKNTAENELVFENGRYIRKIHTNIAYKLASQTKGRVLPIYVSIEGVSLQIGFFRTLLKIWTTADVTVHVGYAYEPAVEGKEAGNHQLIKILTA